MVSVEAENLGSEKSGAKFAESQVELITPKRSVRARKSFMSAKKPENVIMLSSWSVENGSEKLKIVSGKLDDIPWIEKKRAKTWLVSAPTTGLPVKGRTFPRLERKTFVRGNPWRRKRGS